MRTLGLIMDTRRLDVAITRAKVKLGMVGDRQTLLMDFEPFKKKIVKLSQTILLNIYIGITFCIWTVYFKYMTLLFEQNLLFKWEVMFQSWLHLADVFFT